MRKDLVSKMRIILKCLLGEVSEIKLRDVRKENIGKSNLRTEYEKWEEHT